MPKIQESKGRFWITLPKPLVLAMGWKKGKNIDIRFNDRGKLEITG